MTTKMLSQVIRGDRILTPKGEVVVTSFSHNWVEDFRSKAKTSAVDTVTLVGTLNGKQVRLTAPASRTVEVAE